MPGNPSPEPSPPELLSPSGNDSSSGRGSRRARATLGKVMMAAGAAAMLSPLFSGQRSSAPPRLSAVSVASSNVIGAFTGAIPEFPEDFVFDAVGVLAPEKHQELAAAITELSEATGGGQLAVALFTTLSGIPVEEAALRLARAWRIGRDGVDDGALLLISTADRQVRLEIGIGWEGAIPDSKAGDMVDAAMPELKAGDWAGAALEIVRQVRAAALGQPAPKRPKPKGGSGDATVPLGMFSAFFGFVLWDSSRERKKRMSAAPRAGGGARPSPSFQHRHVPMRHVGPSRGGRFGGGGASRRF